MAASSLTSGDPHTKLEELKREAALFALVKAARDLIRELRRTRRKQRELHDDEEDGWP